MLKYRFLICFTFASIAVGQFVPPPKITLPHGGTLRGTHMNTIHGRIIDTFLGVPYAEPPIGKLRFADPVPKAWKGHREARAKSDPCPQIFIYGESDLPFGDEDCLYLNVYTPRNRRKHSSLPVMVYIQAGAYFMESSDPSIYGPQRLLDHDIVLVTFNYRLGALGFLSTGTEDSPGNFGLKDQNMVLHWVQENIGTFGGNPAKVTLFGQGIGAACVSLHMASPASKGLFSKAIMQSGSYFDPWAILSKEKAIKSANVVADYVGCPKNPYKLMIDCMRNVPALKLAWAQQKLFTFRRHPIVFIGPVIESHNRSPFLPKDPRGLAYIHGNEIPLIFGTVSDNGALVAAEIINQYSSEMRKNFYSALPQVLMYDEKPPKIQHKITRNIEKHYFKDGLDWSRSNYRNLSDMLSDRYVYAGMDAFLRQRFNNRKKRKGETYLYLFDHNGPRSFTDNVGGGGAYYGVAHFDELPFLFPYGQLGIPSRIRDKQMYWAMPQMWTDFARTGNPTPRGSLIVDKWKKLKRYPHRYAKIGFQYFHSHTYPILGLHPRGSYRMARQHSEIATEAVLRKNSTNRFDQLGLNKNIFEPANQFYPNFQANEENVDPNIAIDDFENDEHFIGKDNTDTFSNNNNSTSNGKAIKSHREGRSYRCRSNVIYCKIIRNKKGFFGRPESANLYY